jgi:23S rRNA (uracil1939-C5)-methyltransferase
VYGGSGLARVDGEVLLVPGVLPGEQIRLAKKGRLKAQAVERLTGSPERIPAPCPHFGACGGCQYQHARYPAQLEWKAGILREQFKRVGKFEYTQPIATLAGPEYGYRNRSQFQVAEGRIGYFEEGSHDLVPVKDCLISSPAIIGALKKIRNFVPHFVRRFELFTNETEVQLNVLDTGRPIAKAFFEKCAAVVPGILSPALDYRVGGDRFRVSHASFFQVNRFLLERMVEAVVGQSSGGTAFDLYCGVGLFTLPLARQFAKVVGVELGASASRDLEFNIERAGISNIRTVRNQAESWLAAITDSPDLIVADPPRAGLGKAAVAELNRLKPRELVLAACDPSTLSRDLAGLLAGGFEITSVTMVDLFPQTYHLEAVIRLRHSS